MRKHRTKRILLGCLGVVLLLGLLIQPVMAMTGTEFDWVATLTTLFSRVETQDDKIADLQDQVKELQDLLNEKNNPPEIITTEDPKDPVVDPEPITEDKDDETVDPKPDPKPDPEPDPELTLKLTVIAVEGGLKMSWTKETSEDLRGYKVVISENNPTPSYPDDGYLRWITDRDETTLFIDNSETYNGGDIDGYLKPDTSYYFTITYLYEDAKKTTETVIVKTPSDLWAPEVIEPLDPSSLVLSVEIVENALRLNWTAEPSSCLRGYKVVISKSNPTPSYPDDGYLRWITDWEENTILIDNSEAYNGGDIESYLLPDTAYTFTITYLYDDFKVTTQPVTLITPAGLPVSQ